MESAANKSERLAQLEQLLIANPQGLKKAEIARRLGVNRSTIGRYIDELSGRHDSPVPIYDDDGLIKINRDQYLNYIGLTIHEAMAVHLATRLMATRTDKHNRHAAAALRKLGQALETFAPLVSQTVTASANTIDDAARRQDENYMRTLEILTRAWSDRQMVRVWHRYEDGGKVFDYRFAPYFIEPYAVGQTTHAIGRRIPPDALRTFKLERIERVELLDETYTIPADFDPQARLAEAWGIWYTESEPVEVRLKFHRSVAGRVKETQWHTSETIADQPDGSIIWQAKIAEPKEMLNWIRGWGADVEVLEPEGLREEIMKTVVNLNRVYRNVTTTKFLYHLPYAKTNPDDNQEIHLLLYHLIDVGQVALLMWQEVLTDSFRQRLAHMLNLTGKQAGQFIAFLAALHDLGKAGPAYQQKYAPPWLKKELIAAGLGLEGFGKAYDKTFPHGTVSTWALMELLPEMLGLDPTFAYQIAVAIGGHHGSWPPPGAEDRLDDSKYPMWAEVRRDLVWEMRSVFQPPLTASPPADKTELNTWLTLLSGLVSVADWLGSRNKECFGFVEHPLPTRQYAARSAKKARESLEDLGWLGWRPSGQTVSFTKAFDYLNFKETRGMQAEVISAAKMLASPALLILEAPTGIGKTEIGVYLAESWLQRHSGRGLYVAMPTQATSNQMYGRIGDFLYHRYPNMPLNYHLVHGQAAWQDKLDRKIDLQTIGDDPPTGVMAESWFIPRKRTLLAPFGVGTVDQTLMSILQTRHFFVRLFGLSHKVIIFDEVHAYDTFMSALFYRLLEWLRAIGTSVIILSATLPAKTRHELVAAYTGQSLPEETPVVYPSLTLAPPDSNPQIVTLPKPEDVSLQLCWEVSREPGNIVEFLQVELAGGGCAAVICNTVRRAQDIYRVLDGARQAGKLDLPEEDLILFHSRFPPLWRTAIEQTVLAKFGKPNKDNSTPRPQKAIVVATQVIEQSLDLDFDLMLTDLAPVDLIIQRAGRLHRHHRPEAERYGHTRRLVITRPTLDEAGLPDFESDAYVYEPYILLRSYLTLRRQETLAIPGDTSDLIETVYGDLLDEAALSPAWQEALHETRREMEKNQREAAQKANRQLVLAPSKSRLLKQCMSDLDEESPDVHETFRAQTRDIDPGISLICLHRTGETLFIHTKEGEHVINLAEEVPRDLIKQYQQNMITLQHKGLIGHFIEQPPPASWQKEAALRHCRPVIFENGGYSEHPKYTLKLSQALGLEIIKKEEV